VEDGLISEDPRLGAGGEDLSLFRALDANRDGVVTREEFRRFCTRKLDAVLLPGSTHPCHRPRYRACELDAVLPRGGRDGRDTRTNTRHPTGRGLLLRGSVVDAASDATRSMRAGDPFEMPRPMDRSPSGTPATVGAEGSAERDRDLEVLIHNANSPERDRLL